MSFNSVTLVGNLGGDPELRYTPQGTPVCSFTMATNDKRKDKNGEMKDEATWFRVTLWGRMAENASEYLAKGSLIYIVGRLRIDNWTDRDGKPRFTLEVNGSDMKFIGSKKDDGEHSGGNPPNQNPDPSDDDVPF